MLLGLKADYSLGWSLFWAALKYLSMKKYYPKKMNAIGKAAEFCKRERKITPARLGISLISSLASNKVETLADLHRSFNAITGSNVQYKAFHNQLKKAGFSSFMMDIMELFMNELIVQTLGFPDSSPFSQFDRILMQDGSSFAVKDQLMWKFPGRFTKISPAAVEIHALLNLQDGDLEQISLTADKESEQGQLPEAENLENTLLLLDRGYQNLKYLSDVYEHGGFFLVRAKTNLNPFVHRAVAGNKELKVFRGKQLKNTRHRLKKKTPVDMDVSWKIGGATKHFRMLATWNPKTEEHQYLITNLPINQFSAKDLCLAYKLRWQVELFFKEWKSYANLHRFNTQEPEIVEGLIWASIAAALFKRFLAHVTQIEKQVEISTRKVAMCSAQIFPLFTAVFSGKHSQIRKTIVDIIAFLSKNALRSHPKRDRLKGRLQLGLEPIFGCA